MSGRLHYVKSVVLRQVDHAGGLVVQGCRDDPDKEMRARWEKLKNSTKIWDDPMVAEEFERGLLHPQLARELYMLPSEVLLTRAIKEMVLIIS
ncbi:hypothetical protein GW17_00027685 [Ensete ventricosum]|nr:hypothetical protein GW17_00027685 [Ensete ventricosum]